MEKEKIYQYMESHLDQYISILKTVVELESPSHEDKSISDKCGEFLYEIFGDLGFDVEKIPQSTCGDDVYGEMGDGEKGILFVGHYDTVFPIGSIDEKMPFRQSDSEDRLYGPGVMDMKGGIIMAYMAIKALKELNLLPKKKIGIFFNSDEESGSFCSSDLIVSKGREYEHVFVMEPGGTDKNYLKVHRKGRGTYTITATGVAAHSGTNPHRAISPIEEISHQILRIKEINDESEGATLATTHIAGGIAGTCVIPEKAFFTIDVRSDTEEIQSALHDKIMNLKPIMNGITLDIDGKIDKPVMLADMDLFEKAKNIGKSYGLDLVGTSIGGGSDGNFTAAAGISTLDGLGTVGDLLHNPGEYAYISSIPARTAMVAQLLSEL